MWARAALAAVILNLAMASIGFGGHCGTWAQEDFTRWNIYSWIELELLGDPVGRVGGLDNLRTRYPESGLPPTIMANIVSHATIEPQLKWFFNAIWQKEQHSRKCCVLSWEDSSDRRIIVSHHWHGKGGLQSIAVLPLLIGQIVDSLRIAKQGPNSGLNIKCRGFADICDGNINMKCDASFCGRDRHHSTWESFIPRKIQTIGYPDAIFWYGYAVYLNPWPLVSLHFLQLSLENPSGCSGGYSSYEGKYCSDPQHHYRIFFVLAFLAFIGMSAAAIGVYRFLNFGEGLGLVLEIAGGTLFGVALSSIWGFAAVCGS